MKMTKAYIKAKDAKVGETIVCPSCKKVFVKKSYNQIFCSNAKTKRFNNCKDKYWNTVDPNKRNNTTRISPASKAWSAMQDDIREAQSHNVVTEFGVWHDDDWCEADGGSGVLPR